MLFIPLLVIAITIAIAVAVAAEQTSSALACFERIDTASQLQRFERNNQLLIQAMKILDKVSPEKKSMLDSFKGKREIEPEDLGSIEAGSPKVISICSKICELEKQKAESENW